MTSWPLIYLKDAYFQIPVHISSRKWLRLVSDGTVRQFRILCFGLSTAPQVFTRVFATVSDCAHARGVRLLRYLNDWLVLASTEARARQHVRDLLSLCNSLWVVLNREVRPQPVTVGGVSRYDHRHSGCPSLPYTISHRQVNRHSEKIPSESGSSRPALAGVVGTHVIAGEAGSPRKTQNALTPMASEVTLVPRERPSQPPGTPVLADRGGPLLVDGERPPTRGDTLRNTNPGPLPILRCVPGGLGSSPPRPVGVGSMVALGELVTHQSPGVKGPVPGTPCVQAPSHRPPSDCDVRQFDCSCLCEQAGGTVSDSFCLLTGQLLRWTESNRVQLDARYLLGQSNVLVDLLSRRNQVVGAEWSLHPQVARDLLRTWGTPHSTCSQHTSMPSCHCIVP